MKHRFNNRLNKLYSQQWLEMVYSMVNTPTELREILLILEFFAVRTMNEVTILSCYRVAGEQVSVEPCLTLPTTTSKATFSRSISDLAFDTLGSKVIVITDSGYWTVFEIFVRSGRFSESSSGQIETFSNHKTRTGWWKIAWIDHTNEVLVAESNSLHLLDVMVPFSL